MIDHHEVSIAERPDARQRAPHSRARFAVFLLGFLFVAGPVLAWTTSLDGEIVAGVLFATSFVVAMANAIPADVDDDVIAVPVTVLSGMVILVPGSRVRPPSQG